MTQSPEAIAICANLLYSWLKFAVTTLRISQIDSQLAKLVVIISYWIAWPIISRLVPRPPMPPNIIKNEGEAVVAIIGIAVLFVIGWTKTREVSFQMQETVCHVIAIPDRVQEPTIVL
jgi:hypothetical protein